MNIQLQWKRLGLITAIILAVCAVVLATMPVTAQDDTFTLQILHASDLEGGVEAIGDAPNFAAVVEALEMDADVQGIP